MKDSSRPRPRNESSGGGSRGKRSGKPPTRSGSSPREVGGTRGPSASDRSGLARSTKGSGKVKRESDRLKRPRPIEPDFPSDVEAKMLPGKVRAELLSLSAENAEIVAKQLVMIERLISSQSIADLNLADQFAAAASNRAGRVGVVRSQAGRVALAIGNFADAKRHLSAALRISGQPMTQILLAECETGLGRPRKALEALGAVDPAKLSKKELAYAHLISAEAREALGQVDAARVTLTARSEDFLRSASEQENPDQEVVPLMNRWRSLKSRLIAK
jgi:tetratricopeptide (TPR) repeat protein